FFPVPPGAAIDSMTLVVNGKEFKARLLAADEARQIYEDIVRRKKDPALLEYAGYGLYRTRAFPLEKDTPARVQVTYKQVCKKDGETVEVWYPLNTEKFSAKRIEDVRVTVDIKSPADITAVYSPTHEVDVKRENPRHVIATYHEKNTLPTTDIQVFYKSANEAVGASLLTHQPEEDKDGYFLMLVSPNPRQDADNIAPKDVVIAVDHSGSMSGETMRQARQAVNHVLAHLNAKDRFNVIAYSDSVRPLFDGLVEASEANVTRACEDVDRIASSGGTAIYDALQAALGQWKDKGERARYVIFLTDGQPTIPAHNRPETIEEDVILRETAKANEHGTRIFAFGVGYDVNVRLLDKLVRDNHGRSDYVKPNEPIERKVASLYNKIKNPVMTNLAVKLQGVRVYDTYPREIGDLFEGDQIVIAGRYDPRDAAKLSSPEAGVHTTQLVITGTYQGKSKGFEYPVRLTANRGRLGFDFVETIWATRRVGYLMDQIQLHGKSDELIDELVRLSKTYGIITPYTSFLADETVPLHSPVAVRAKAAEEADELARDVEGWAGQNAAATRQELNETSVAMRKSGPAPTASPEPGAGEVAKADAPAMFGNAEQAGYEQARKERVGGLRNVGNQAVYQRGRVWVAANAADIDLAKDAEKVQVVERFSDEYFQLVHRNTKLENEIMASQGADEELVIRLRGQAYRIR
ncbi:MAG: VWA domain-containing protein, partial [Phycisphaerae bacterium]|nr:VWA domain-containing protein [Phycisphaerae bacterium]